MKVNQSFSEILPVYQNLEERAHVLIREMDARRRELSTLRKVAEHFWPMLEKEANTMFLTKPEDFSA